MLKSKVIGNNKYFIKIDLDSFGEFVRSKLPKDMRELFKIQNNDVSNNMFASFQHYKREVVDPSICLMHFEIQADENSFNKMLQRIEVFNTEITLPEMYGGERVIVTRSCERPRITCSLFMNRMEIVLGDNKFIKNSHPRMIYSPNKDMYVNTRDFESVYEYLKEHIPTSLKKYFQLNFEDRASEYKNRGAEQMIADGYDKKEVDMFAKKNKLFKNLYLINNQIKIEIDKIDDNLSSVLDNSLIVSHYFDKDGDVQFIKDFREVKEVLDKRISDDFYNFIYDNFSESECDKFLAKYMNGDYILLLNEIFLENNFLKNQFLNVMITRENANILLGYKNKYNIKFITDFLITELCDLKKNNINTNRIAIFEEAYLYDKRNYKDVYKETLRLSPSQSYEMILKKLNFCRKYDLNYENIIGRPITNEMLPVLENILNHESDQVVINNIINKIDGYFTISQLLEFAK